MEGSGGALLLRVSSPKALTPPTGASPSCLKHLLQAARPTRSRGTQPSRPQQRGAGDAQASSLGNSVAADTTKET